MGKKSGKAGRAVPPAAPPRAEGADVADPGSLISECDRATVEGMLSRGAVSAGMIPKLSAVREALLGGVEAAHIVDGRVPHAVLIEVLTEAGVGTKVTG